LGAGFSAHNPTDFAKSFLRNRLSAI